MSDPDVSRMVDRENDILYRKVDPDHWNPETYELYPTAFEDVGKPNPNLSFFVGRFKTPEEVLHFFGQFGATKATIGIRSRPSSRRMFGANYRIATIRAANIDTLGLTYEIIDGHEISLKGHVNILQGRNHAIRFLRFARCLTEHETFGIS